MTEPRHDSSDDLAHALGKLPQGKLIRAAKAANALAPSSLRFFTTLGTNIVRSPESAHELLERRHEQIADHALVVLGELRGGAMKLGQLASLVDVDYLPPEFREIYQRKLGKLRDSAPPMSFGKVRGVLEREWEAPPESLFEDFEHDAFAAASIGQVHRALLPDGRRVAVKVQYPEIAKALEADLGTAAGLATVGTPLAKAIMPGLQPQVLLGELRERVLEEVDYELEAQHQRAFARAYRGHPFIHIPDVVTELSRQRVLVAEYVDGRRFDEMLELPQAERDRIGEILQRFYFGAMDYVGRFNTDPHPGNYLLRDDGKLALLDFGSVKLVDPVWLERSKSVMKGLVERDAARVANELAALGYVHRPDRLDADATTAQARAANEWILRDEPVQITPNYAARMVADLTSPRAVDRPLAAMRDLKLPAEEIWFRRVQLSVVSVLAKLRARGNWHRTMREFVYWDEPASELGREERAFFARRLGPRTP